MSDPAATDLRDLDWYGEELGAVVHTGVTFTDVDLPAGTEVRMVVGAVGSLDFFCKFHPGMTGTLVIAP